MEARLSVVHDLSAGVFVRGLNNLKAQLAKAEEHAAASGSYHVTTAYRILRNQGVQLTMGDFLGNWGTS